jgi:ubiquinone/menaquinone biosynthesis C-methylase UbiE
MLPRVLEPEVMDTAEEALDYDLMDHSAVNRLFVDDLLEAAKRFGFSGVPAAPHNSGQGPLRVLDVGTGTALIPIEFCHRPVNAIVVAIDLAVEMLKLAKTNVCNAGLDDRITLERSDGKALNYDNDEFDWVISNSIVHHIPEPLDALTEMLRVLRPGGFLFIRDLARPQSSDEVEHVVKTYAGDSNESQQQLLRQSLHAALTVEEIRAFMTGLNWQANDVAMSSDRHWTVCGVKPLSQ